MFKARIKRFSTTSYLPNTFCHSSPTSAVKELTGSPGSAVMNASPDKARNGKLLRCLKCNATVPRRASRLRKWIDFFFLYLMGMYELLRQWLCTVRIRDDYVIQFYKDIDVRKPIIVMSGVTSGIGSELMRHFLATSAHVIALSYHPRPAFNRKYTMLTVDFESEESTLAAAKDLIALLRHVSQDRDVIFVHCAAVYNPPDANDSNSVQRTLLINTLLPAAFIESISSAINGMICIGSSSQKVSPNLKQGCILTAARSPYAAYPLSKLLNLVHATDWKKRSSKPCIVIHPGIVATKLYQNESGIVGAVLRLFVYYFAWDVETSALRILHLLEASGFLETMGRCSRREDFLNSTDYSGVYWDSVSLKASSIPREVHKYYLRGLARHILQITEQNFQQISQTPSGVAESLAVRHRDLTPLGEKQTAPMQS